MGVNLESSSLLLPTTRLLLAVKRARGGRPDMTASAWTPNDRERSLVTLARAGARFTIWSLEEWLRQAAAAAYTLRGYIVVFDRHFLLDYYHADVVGGTGRRSVWSRLHGWMLLHAYPKPDLVICLDAPAAVLHARKPESSVDWLEERRRQYLSLQELVPALVVLDVDRPLEDVLASVQQCITDHWEGAA
jgi:thymidylate kinase